MNNSNAEKKLEQLSPESLDYEGKVAPPFPEYELKPPQDTSSPNWFGKLCCLFIAFVIVAKGFKLWGFSMGELSLVILLGFFSVIAVPLSNLQWISRLFGKK